MASGSPGGAPQLGATFVPGGFDDYYMPAPPPELVSPAPQRITPEVPENMQNNLANLELGADSSTSVRSSATSQPHMSPRNPPSNPSEPQQHLDLAPPAQNRQSYQSYHSAASPTPQPAQPADMPHFSPFPPIVAKPNVPPSDDEKEQILEKARHPVLSSTDPDIQLAWAQDVLAFVATSQLHEEHIAINQPQRPATPEVEHQLRVDATNIVNFLADQHHPKAEFMRGMWLEFGSFGVRQDKREAFRCYARAAEQGYARAEYRMGMQFEQNNDPVKALIHYQRGAEAGDSASNYRLGMMTVMGQMGQQQDFARGLQMLQAAAEHADENAPQGAYVLGMLQVRRLPQVTIPEVLLPYDEEAARLNIEKAAYLGFAKAQLEMGAAYELCSLGCEFDPALSLHYNALAARQGEAEAEMAISKWFLCGYDGVFQKNEELAYIYAERAAQSGLSTAEFAMGYFNEIGIHIPINLDKAKEWYEKAAANGNQDALARIESLKNDKSLSKQDHEQVAINRIKSQYGSKRGPRPDRFKSQPPPPMPTVADEAGGSVGGVQRPPRVSSVAPYPMSEQPPQIARPSTTAPYPTGDGPPQNRGPGPAGGFFDPSSRPDPSKARHSSAGAFHVNPQLYGQPQRPSTTVNDMRGRPNQGAPGGPLQRQPSGFGGRGGPDMGYNGPPGRTNSMSPRPGQQPMQDIGFVAPLQPRRQSPNQQGGRPMQGGGPAYPPNAATPRPMQGPPGQGGFGGPGGQVQRPPRGDSRQPGVGGRASGRPGPGPGGPGPAGPKPPPAKSGLVPPKQITGNGPKTFAEMGIPTQQKEGECIIM